jgi:histidine kinase
MEMCLDITRRKQLEEDLEATEKKYQAIFNNIPNSVFILDMDTLEIQDCNQSVESVYGFERSETVGKCFLSFFTPEDRDHCESRLKKIAGVDKIRHLTKDGRNIIVNISVSVSEWLGRKVPIVATSDITQRLEAEQQLIQAGKMTTLGEMATGIAHELNQPLSVIRTASNFMMRKATKKEKLDREMFLNIASKISNNVDRAASIIDHLRDFGRKSDLVARRVEVNKTVCSKGPSSWCATNSSSEGSPSTGTSEPTWPRFSLTQFGLNRSS